MVSDEEASIRRLLENMIKYMKAAATTEEYKEQVPAREALARRLVEQAIDLLKEADTSEKNQAPLAVASMAIFAAATAISHFAEINLRDDLNVLLTSISVTDSVLENLGDEKHAELATALEEDNDERVNELLKDAGPGGLLLKMARAARNNNPPQVNNNSFGNWSKSPKKGPA